MTTKKTKKIKKTKSGSAKPKMPEPTLVHAKFRVYHLTIPIKIEVCAVRFDNRDRLDVYLADTLEEAICPPAECEPEALALILRYGHEWVDHAPADWYLD